MMEQLQQEDSARAAAAVQASPGVFRVRVLHSSATDLYSCPAGMELAGGDLVVVSTRYGTDLGRVQGRVSMEAAGNIEPVLRKATQRDVERFEANRQKEERAFQICREKIAGRGLAMKLISAHYLLEEAKILFYFAAESRIDFRELVRDLVGVFKMRIELRQIGVRDESRVVGGMGICGRAFCCHSVTDKLKAVSIKMAKEQNLTLNSMKISGACGRLLCCLSYEYEGYREIRKGLPREGTRLKVDGQSLKVVDINIFLRQVKLEAEDGSAHFLGFASFVLDPDTQRWRVERS
jgi:cell fate regulator YaaT (PSP1 superfamily)